MVARAGVGPTRATFALNLAVRRRRAIGWTAQLEAGLQAYGRAISPQVLAQEFLLAVGSLAVIPRGLALREKGVTE